MGQHKYNPTAIAAAKGEIPPKKKPQTLSQKETENLIIDYIKEKYFKEFGQELDGAK